MLVTEYVPHEVVTLAGITTTPVALELSPTATVVSEVTT